MIEIAGQGSSRAGPTIILMMLSMTIRADQITLLSFLDRSSQGPDRNYGCLLGAWISVVKVQSTQVAIVAASEASRRNPQCVNDLTLVPASAIAIDSITKLSRPMVVCQAPGLAKEDQIPRGEILGPGAEG